MTISYPPLRSLHIGVGNRGAHILKLAMKHGCVPMDPGTCFLWQGSADLLVAHPFVPVQDDPHVEGLSGVEHLESL